jgi:hypothetical protein
MPESLSADAASGRALYAEPLARFVGQECWRARRGHGAFLTFDFGALIQDGRFGEWHLWLYFGDWLITSGDTAVCDWLASDKEIERAVGRFAGRSIVRVEIEDSSGTARFVFSDNLAVTVKPSNADRQGDAAWWYLYCPDGHVLEVGEGPRWSYTSADETS